MRVLEVNFATGDVASGVIERDRGAGAVAWITCSVIALLRARSRA